MSIYKADDLTTLASNSNVWNSSGIVSNILFLVNAPVFFFLCILCSFGWEFEHFMYSNMVTLEIRFFPSYRISFVTCWGLQLSVCMTVFPNDFAKSISLVACSQWSFCCFIMWSTCDLTASLNTSTQVLGRRGREVCLSF